MMLNEKIIVPPLKIQGIKTKLIPMIKNSIEWNAKDGTWFEPFLGSGSVLFNIQPPNALVSDTNKHIINVYKGIQDNSINGAVIRDFLESEGDKLLKSDGEYYYEVRERFNSEESPLDFIFLNRSCFNGMMRFNRKGKFNVPFCRKPERFRKALVTKISNQIQTAAKIMEGKNWTFEVANWKETISHASDKDFIYLDPPYIGLHADYYNKWTEEDAFDLLHFIKESPAGYALSMWKSNQYRSNYYLRYWKGQEFTSDHFYHVGAKEKNRNAVVESLIVDERYANKRKNTKIEQDLLKQEQLSLF